jgi:hypothetical protein
MEVGRTLHIGRQVPLDIHFFFSCHEYLNGNTSRKRLGSSWDASGLSNHTPFNFVLADVTTAIELAILDFRDFECSFY